MRDSPNLEEQRSPRAWGSLARKGTRQLKEPGAGAASEAWRQAIARARGDGDERGAPQPREREPWEPEVWVREDKVERRGAPARRRRQPPRDPAIRPSPPGAQHLPAEVGAELAQAVGTARAARLQERLVDASRAYERDRYRDAVRMLKPLAEQAPGSAAVRELLGLARYRLGHWHEAIKELEAFRTLTGSFDQHPTLADCYRAKKRWRQVDELWEELREASPSAELVTEGRIVTAGSLADRGRVADAIALLERAKTESHRPKHHHLRLWYALADLYERAGELSRARDLFRRVIEVDADLYDAAERLAGIE